MLTLRSCPPAAGKLDANTRADLMAKLARTDRPLELPPTPM